jgi:hypothetical protein
MRVIRSGSKAPKTTNETCLTCTALLEVTADDLRITPKGLRFQCPECLAFIAPQNVTPLDAAKVTRPVVPTPPDDVG